MSPKYRSCTPKFISQFFNLNALHLFILYCIRICHARKMAEIFFLMEMLCSHIHWFACEENLARVLHKINHFECWKTCWIEVCTRYSGSWREIVYIHINWWNIEQSFKAEILSREFIIEVLYCPWYYLTINILLSFHNRFYKWWIRIIHAVKLQVNTKNLEWERKFIVV